MPTCRRPAPTTRRTTPSRAPWSRSDRPVARTILQPLQAFLQTEAASGVLLLGAAVLALAWANSPWGDSYERLWHQVLTVKLGGFDLTDDLRHWVNDGLMALFFLVVGLEIKRELLTGELTDARAAVLPAIAALGGMVVPAVLFLMLNASGDAARGWGVPMATDIAFALGVLTLAARYAPAGLKSFLLTLAIVDDIGAIFVIAVFYSSDIRWWPLAAALVLVAAVLGLQRIHVRATAIYVVLGVVLWVAVFESGVHATIAGVVLGLLTPTVPFQRPQAVSDEAHRVADATVDDPEPPDADAPQWLSLADLSREAVSPLARVEHVLHPCTSYVVVPLFAFANAGVRVTGGALGDAVTSTVALGVFVGLVAGKLVGISVFSWLAVRLRLGRLPDGVTWRHVVGASAVAGIGFTVSLFVADLAFGTGPLGDAARVGILAASALAGVIGFSLLRTVPDARAPSTKAGPA